MKAACNGGLPISSSTIRLMLNSEDESDGSDPTGGTLINSYGLYWSRDAVDWNSQKLLGERRHYKVNKNNTTKKIKDCNVWSVRGIYALYSNFKLIYAGLAGSNEGIGSRLKAHTEKPRLAKRWDSFSWFGIDGFNDDGTSRRYVDNSVPAEILVRSFELIAIFVADPPLNRSQGRFKGAEQIVQAPRQLRSSPSLSDLEVLLRQVLEEVKEL